MLDARTIQRHLGVKVDGLIGQNTIQAARLEVLREAPTSHQWNNKRAMNAYSQIILKSQGFDVGSIDGYIGSQSLWALEQYQNVLRNQDAAEEEISHQKEVFPRQKDVPEYYGKVEEHQTRLKLPYKMKLAWDTDTVVSRITLHEKVADSAGEAFKRILDHYGEHMINILGLNMFGGSLNVRKMRGGSKYSMHSWGIAIDFDPTNNQFRWTDAQASLAKKDYVPFWEIWESVGWVSLGREKNYDWMHVQAARL